MTMTPDISDPREASHAGIYLLAAFAVGQALHVNDGNLHPVALIWITLAIVLLGLVLCAKTGWLARFSFVKIAAFCLCIEWVDQLWWGAGFRRAPGASSIGFVIPMLIAGAGAAFLFSRSRARIGLILLILGHTLAGVDVIHSTKAPFIDALYFQQESAAALLHGHNPYEVRYRNIYDAATNYYSAAVCDGEFLTVSHPYPPLTLLIAAPAQFLGDLRFSHLAALELAALFVAFPVPVEREAPAEPTRHSRKRLGRSLALPVDARAEPEHGARKRLGRSLALPVNAPQIAAAMLLFCPRSLMVVYFGWTEVFVIVCIAAAIFCAVRAPKCLWIALGCALASKQYMVLLLPLMFLIANRATVIKAISLAGAITLPFVLWNPAAFFRSVVLMQMLQPFRTDALSFPALLAHYTGMQSPSIVAFLAAGAAMIWAWRRMPRRIDGFAAAGALVFICFFAFNKQAFCNYYFLAGAMCACAAATCAQRTVEQTVHLQSELRLAA